MIHDFWKHPTWKGRRGLIVAVVNAVQWHDAPFITYLVTTRNGEYFTIDGELPKHGYKQYGRYWEEKQH